MNGIHDCGGMHGIGPIVVEEHEPLFHAPWERRMFGMFIAVFGAGVYNVDEFRFAIERMKPTDYLTTTYYEKWFHSLSLMLAEKGIISPDELSAKIESLRG